MYGICTELHRARRDRCLAADAFAEAYASMVSVSSRWKQTAIVMRNDVEAAFAKVDACGADESRPDDRYVDGA